jgi:hypothetical protein
MALTEHGGRSTTWSYLVEFLTQERNPWDRGVLDAHWYTGAPTAQLQAALTLAKTRRRRFLALISAWRRKYLDGLIWGLEKELERRIRVNEA